MSHQQTPPQNPKAYPRGDPSRVIAMTTTAGEEEESPRVSPREKLRAGLQVAGSLVAKLNIGSWINELEESQVLADDLEELNADLIEEADNKIIVASVKADCLDDIKSHLDSFVANHAGGTYVEWIGDLHPDNVAADGTIDSRFFATNSDHRLLWNEKMAATEGSCGGDRMVGDHSAESSTTTS
jgi:hypothetical protein